MKLFSKYGVCISKLYLLLLQSGVLKHHKLKEQVVNSFFSLKKVARGGGVKIIAKEFFCGVYYHTVCPNVEFFIFFFKLVCFYYHREKKRQKPIKYHQSGTDILTHRGHWSFAITGFKGAVKESFKRLHTFYYTKNGFYFHRQHIFMGCFLSKGFKA